MSVQVEEATSSTKTTDFGAVVIGAGFGGLRILHELRQRGISARVIEAGSDVGGTWYWNRYPGARTDSEAWVYCFSFSEEVQQEWNWKERFPAQPEVLEYLNFVADRFDLRRDIQFGTRVRSAVYDESTNVWTVTTDKDETYTSTFLITATGPLSHPLDPPFEGLDSFEGDWYLTARWPKRPVDFTGKRVGLVGTGATGVQVAPVVAEQAAHLTVFQRTPNYVIPANNRPLTDDERTAIKARYDEIWDQTQRHVFAFSMDPANRTRADVTPEQQREVLEAGWRTGGFQYLFETFDDLLVDEESNEAAAEFLRSKIREIVKDPQTAELLCPKGYPLGGKRPPLGHSYYETFNRDNVTLVDVSMDPIERVTPKGGQAPRTTSSTS
jgi:cation diffusion facilitator CzcD-associated flavoprotein CzcO